MSKLHREGPLRGTVERNRLAEELRRRRTGQQSKSLAPANDWSKVDIAEMEVGDREHIRQMEELRRLKDRLLP